MERQKTLPPILVGRPPTKQAAGLASGPVTSVMVKGRVAKGTKRTTAAASEKATGKRWSEEKGDGSGVRSHPSVGDFTSCGLKESTALGPLVLNQVGEGRGRTSHVDEEDQKGYRSDGFKDG